MFLEREGMMYRRLLLHRKGKGKLTSAGPRSPWGREGDKEIRYKHDRPSISPPTSVESTNICEYEEFSCILFDIL